MLIQDSHVIITGGSSGIGKETAKEFISKGAKVLITGRTEDKLMAVASEIGAIPLVFDIANLESIPEKSKEAFDLLEGKVDTLINNAGIGILAKLGDIPIAHFKKVYNTNVFGLALFTQEVIPHFKAQQFGNIINIGSTGSLKGAAGGTVYAGSKFALRAMTLTWQIELRKDNIRVSQINPSEVTTAFADEGRVEREEVNNKLGALDIAHAIVSMVEMRDKAFITEMTVWATNPF